MSERRSLLDLFSQQFTPEQAAAAERQLGIAPPPPEPPIAVPARPPEAEVELRFRIDGQAFFELGTLSGLSREEIVERVLAVVTGAGTGWWLPRVTFALNDLWRIDPHAQAQPPHQNPGAARLGGDLGRGTPLAEIASARRALEDARAADEERARRVGFEHHAHQQRAAAERARIYEEYAAALRGAAGLDAERADLPGVPGRDVRADAAVPADRVRDGGDGLLPGTAAGEAARSGGAAGDGDDDDRGSGLPPDDRGGEPATRDRLAPAPKRADRPARKPDLADEEGGDDHD